jgi:uncharacterized protein YndB with AHSA1/START domain
MNQQAPLSVTTPSDSEVVVTRAFAAPRQLVWDCHTKPELIRRWMLGPDGWSMPVCEVDLRVGGKYHHRWRNDADGAEFGFVGEFNDIQSPSRLVSNERLEGMEGEGAINTMVLDEKGGRTMLTLTMRFASKEARDGALVTGMTDGMEASYQRLESVAASVGQGRSAGEATA